MLHWGFELLFITAVLVGVAILFRERILQVPLCAIVLIRAHGFRM